MRGFTIVLQLGLNRLPDFSCSAVYKAKDGVTFSKPDRDPDATTGYAGVVAHIRVCGLQLNHVILTA